MKRNKKEKEKFNGNLLKNKTKNKFIVSTIEMNMKKPNELHFLADSEIFMEQ